MFARLLLPAAALLATLTVPSSAQKLGVGDPAPKLAVARWVKGEPVAAFEKGRTYVVEFWATWCPPCRKSIPHLSELQKKYAAQNVTILGISVFERQAGVVDPFVEKMGEQMDYRVAVDDGTPEKNGQDGTMARTWMTASGQAGIPASFIVDGTGTIAWIGNPMRMEEPLAKIVSGKWDAAAEKKKHEREQRLQTALRSNDLPGALALVEAILADDASREGDLATTRFGLLLATKQYESGYAYGAKLVDGLFKDEANVLAGIASMIVSPGAKLEKKDLPLALRAATRANELTQAKNPGVLDTLARVQFESGDVERAVETQARAVEAARGTSMAGQLEQRLAEYKAALEKKQDS